MTQAVLEARPRFTPLPAPIRRVLGRVRRRLRAAALLRGIGVVALAGTVGALLGMGADFAAPLPQAARWSIWGTWLATVATALVLAMLRPLLRRVAALDLAAVAERAHPELGERLTGAVALVCPPRDTPVQGAPALITALADETAKEVTTVDSARAVPWRRSAQWCALGLALLGLTGAPAAVWPATYGILAHRFLAPWANLERIGRFVITVAPGDQIAALGSDVTVRAQVRPRYGNRAAPDSAWLEWTEAEGHRAWHRVAMPSEDSGSTSAVTPSFAVTLPRLAGSLIYRVGSGSALSRSYRITAIEPPAIAALTATVEPPAYTGLAAAKVADASRIDAWESSRITLNVTASRPVKAITVAWPSPAENEGGEEHTPSPHPVVATLAADGKSGTVTVTAEASGPFVVTMRDGYGLSNRPEAEGTRRVLVHRDAAPVVALAGTDAARQSSATDVLALQVAARDDVAVASVELHYTIERSGGASEVRSESTTGHVAVSLPGLGTRVARGAARLELAPLGLEPGDTLAYRVRVADNRPSPAGPNVTWSPGHSLAIAARAEPLRAQQQKAERDRLQAELDAIRQVAAGNRRETEQLRYAADAAQRGNGRWAQAEQQALEHRESEARGVVDRLQLLARALADQIDPGLRELARPTRQVAEVEAESSRDTLDQARRTTKAAERLGTLRQADHRLAVLEQRLDDLQRQFNALARRDADLQHLHDLARREEALAASAGGQAPAPIDRLQSEQATVQNDLDALLKNSPELRGDVLAAQADEADALARTAHALAERQNDLARRSGDVPNPAQAATLANLAEAQRILEEDARRLALDVDPPLVDSGRGRLNTDVVHDAVAPLERGDLDLARQRLEAAEAELRRLAHDLDDIPANPRAIAQRLVGQQLLLGTQVNEALQPFQGKAEPSAEEKAARTAQLLQLAQRQEDIAARTAAIALPTGSAARKSQAEEALRAARQSTAQAAAALRNDAAAPREITAQLAKALAALKRLVGALPDPAARRAEARRLLDQARRSSNEVGAALEPLLRQAVPRGGDALARRLDPLVKKQVKAAEALAVIEPGPQGAAQLRRARERLKAVTDALEALGAADVPDAKRKELQGSLPRLQAEARAALDRLDQTLSGRVPADELARELAEEQRALAVRLAEPLADDSRTKAAEEQLRIATALRNLPAPDALPAQAEAVRRAELAAEALRAPAPNRDPRAAVAEAAEAAETLAAELAPEAAAAPPTAPAPAAAAAGQLARRQRQVRERVQALLAGQIGPQRALRDQAVALGRALADLNDRTRPLSQRARGPAQEAARTLGEQAPRAMDQGADRLAQGQAAAARDAQRQAAAVVERGAQQAEDLAAALRADGPPPGRGPAQADAASNDAQPQPQPSPLAAARAGMRQAAQRLAGSERGNTSAAQLAMQQAARDLRAAAERGAGGAAATSAPAAEPGAAEDSDTTDPQAALARTGTPDLSALQATLARQTGRAWGELPGHLRTEILEMAAGRYRDDYARLIQLYFREIAAGAGAGRPQR
jgi:hypothetical protein